MDQKAVGEFLKRLRMRAKYTQTDLGAKIGVTDKAVSRWESGLGLPEIGNLMELAKLFGVTVDDVLNLNESVFDVLPDNNFSAAKGETVADNGTYAQSDGENAPLQTCAASSNASVSEVSTSVPVKSKKTENPSVKFRIILLFAYFVFGTFLAVKLPVLGESVCAACFYILSATALAAAVVDLIAGCVPRRVRFIVGIALWLINAIIMIVLMIVSAAADALPYDYSDEKTAAIVCCAALLLLFAMQLLYEISDYFAANRNVEKALDFCAVGIAAALVIMSVVFCCVHGVNLFYSYFDYIILAMMFVAFCAASFSLARAFSKWVNLLTAVIFLTFAVFNCLFIILSWELKLDDTVIDIDDVFNTNLCAAFVMIALAAIVISWFFDGHKPSLTATRVVSVIGIISVIPLAAFTVDAFAVNIIFGSTALAGAAFLRLSVMVALVLHCVKSFRFDLIVRSIGKRGKADEKT